MSWLRDRLRQYAEGFEQRQAARASIPPWAATVKLLIFAASFLAVVGALAYGGFELHELFHPGALAHHIPGQAAGLIVCAAIFAGIPFSLMLSNVVLWIIRPLREIENKAFANAPNASFVDGMRQLSLAAAMIVPFCLVAAGIGIVDPWASP